jgi:hypothetical protein
MRGTVISTWYNLDEERCTTSIGLTVLIPLDTDFKVIITSVPMGMESAYFLGQPVILNDRNEILYQ